MNYWDNRYASGGNSGLGSIGKHKEWKWNTLNNNIENITNIIDVGCGDLSFMDNHTIENYTGIDISNTIIEANKTKHPEWKFICSSADKRISGLKGDVVFCHDVLFHIVDDEVYNNIILNLIEYSNKYISIFTWHKNPLKRMFRSTDNDSYQAYRDFSKYIPIFENPGFSLICNEKSPCNKYGSLYIFKKNK